MKTIEVVAAIIKEGDKIFITQRGYGEFKDMWEFPGGKIEPNESRENALIREIKEELDTIVNIEKYLTTVEYSYPNFHLIMHCYICTVKKGELKLLEHEAAKWILVSELDSTDFLPADILVIDKLKENL